MASNYEAIARSIEENVQGELFVVESQIKALQELQGQLHNVLDVLNSPLRETTTLIDEPKVATASTPKVTRKRKAVNIKRGLSPIERERAILDSLFMGLKAGRLWSRTKDIIEPLAHTKADQTYWQRTCSTVTVEGAEAGLIERRRRSGPGAAYEYRITPEGIEHLSKLRAT